MSAVLPFIAHLTVFLVGVSCVALGVMLIVRGFGFIRSGVARLIASPLLIATGLWFLYKVFNPI